MKAPKTLQEAIQYFADFDNCREFMIAVLWPDAKVRCPYCDSEKVTYLAKARLYRCYGDHPKQKFSLKVGTVFEDSPIPLEKWLPAVWLLVNCRNGISSYEIHRALGVTQKSAWFMMHRIRLAMQTQSFAKFGGGMNSEVEVDETFIGGKVRNMHSSKRNRIVKTLGATAGYISKTAVMGFLDREQRKVRTTVVPNTSRITLQAQVLKHVAEDTNLYTDEAPAYKNLPSTYVHEIVNHAQEYVKGRVHTNGLENFWALLKRGLNGTYVAVEPFHLSRYLDEQTFRYNHRKDENGRKLSDAERFALALSQVAGKRLTFAEVTGKVGETRF
ncbi:MAG: IS1595 family transposase [Terriglobales bacterium]